MYIELLRYIYIEFGEKLMEEGKRIVNISFVLIGRKR